MRNNVSAPSAAALLRRLVYAVVRANVRRRGLDGAENLAGRNLLGIVGDHDRGGPVRRTF